MHARQNELSGRGFQQYLRLSQIQHERTIFEDKRLQLLVLCEGDANLFVTILRFGDFQFSTQNVFPVS
jgi:hypothetical protein